MDINALLGIDLDDPVHRLAADLTQADSRLIDDLIALRRARGLSQQQVAEALSVTQSAIAKFESGDRDPRLSTIRRYALALNAMVEHKVMKAEEPKSEAEEHYTIRVAAPARRRQQRPSNLRVAHSR